MEKENSIREIVYGLRSMEGNLNHLGIIQKVPCKSLLSYINAYRDWEVFRDFYFELYNSFINKSNFRNKKFRLKKKIYLLDSTLISLCIEVYDWANYRKSKGAIKLHTLLDYDGLLPTFIHMSDGKGSDMRMARKIPIPPNSVLVADRGYINISLLKKWDDDKINFVVRCKENVKFIDYEEKELPEDKSLNILKDRIVLLENPETRKFYEKKLRMVAVYCEKNKTTVYLLTNNFNRTAQTISDLFRQCWQIEIFFRDLKSLLKIKTFIGTSSNAVLIQICTATITMLILKYLKKISEFDSSLSNLIAFISMNLFVKISLNEWLNHPFKRWEELKEELSPQLKLF